MYLRLKSNPEFAPKTKHRTAMYVAGIHVLALLLLYLGTIISNFFTPKPQEAISVNLISAAVFQSMESSSSSSSSSQSTPHKKVQKKLEKKVLKPKEKVVKKVVEKAKVPKVEKTVPKKEWKPLDVSQITKPTQEKESREENTKHEYKRSENSFNAKNFESNIKNALSDIKFTAKSGSMVGQNNPQVATYYSTLSSFLYDKWDQPSQLASTTPPTVEVRLTIDGDGKLIDCKIIKLSQFAEMNDSVKSLLDSIRNTRVPAPPNGAITIDASLVLTN